MKIKSSVMLISGLSALMFFVNISFACDQDPVAVLDTDRNIVCTGATILLDATSSYDPDGGSPYIPDGIFKYEWDFDNDGSYDYQENIYTAADGTASGKTTYTAPDSNCTLNIQLRVTDDDGQTDTLATALAITVSDNNDGDNLPDQWEFAYFSDLDQQDNTDFDSDDYNDLCEYLHSTDPNDANSKPNDSSYSVTIYVPSDVNAIQTAIDASIDGDTIIVAQGTYYETIDFSGISCTLRNIDPNDWNDVNTTIINANNASLDVVTFTNSEDANTLLTGFTITGGDDGVYCTSGKPTISKCIIRNNNRGIFTEGSGSGSGGAVITNNKVYDNTGTGISYVHNSTPITQTKIKNNWIYDNGDDGIYGYSYNGVARNNTVVGNNGNGIQHAGPGSMSVSNCIIWDNTDELDGCSATYSCIKDPNDASGTGNIAGDANDPCFVNAGGNDFHIGLNSPCIDTGAPGLSYSDESDIDGQIRLHGTDVDIGADETLAVWYVDIDATGSNDGNSWANAFTSVQDALSVAVFGDQIWVAEGTYKPDTNDPNNRTVSFGPSEGVGVYGGFSGTETSLAQRDWTAHTTILSGDINIPDDANDNSYNVVRPANGCVIDGFVIEDGYANGASCPQYNGGGIACNDGGSVIVENCLLRDNYAKEWGGGIYCGHGSIQVSNCVFTGNEAYQGAGVSYYLSVSDTSNSVFVGNSASHRAGAVYDVLSCSTVRNSTLTGNNAEYGGGIAVWGNKPIIINSILWDNSASKFDDEVYTGSGDPNFSYCDIEGCGGSSSWDPNFGTDGGGNIDIDPCFIDPNNADGIDNTFMTLDDGLQLVIDSNCIDAADGNQALSTDILDFDRVDVNEVNNTGAGEPNYVDIGSYEFTYAYQRPIAILQTNSFVCTGALIVLDASDSCDPDGAGSIGNNGIFKYEWDFDNDGTYDYEESVFAAADGTADGRTTYTAPDSNCTLNIQLKVTDDDGLTDTLAAAFAITVSNNDDGDNLPDAWEFAHFSNLDQQDANNFDSDDYNNLCEYLHGTDPNDANSEPNNSSYSITFYIPSDVNTIQSAIDASIDGDTIIVAQGTYNEAVNFKGRAITLTGSDPNDQDVVSSTIINGGLNPAITFDSNEDSNSTLSGISVDSNNSCGIVCDDSSPVISKCIISTCSFGGIKCDGGSALITECIISGNCVYGIRVYDGTPVISSNRIFDTIAGGPYRADGIYVDPYKMPIIKNNFIYGNADSGICVANAEWYPWERPTIRNNTVVNNTDYGVYVIAYKGPDPVPISNCIVWNNGDDLLDCDATYSCIKNNDTGEGNITGDANDPCFVDADSNDFHLRTYSLCIDAGNPSDNFDEDDIDGGPRVSRGRIDMGADEFNVWYVDADADGNDNGMTWTDAFEDLQSALNEPNLKAGEEIWVAEGTYKPDTNDPNNRAVSFEMVEAVSVYGGFSGNELYRQQRNWTLNQTVLSGDINEPNDANDNSYNVVKTADDCVIDGFVIEAGFANGPNSPQARGGGISCEDSGPAVIENCVIQNNYADTFGGGLYCRYGGIRVSNSVFTGNSAFDGGGLAYYISSVDILSSVFVGNSATNDGGAVYDFLGYGRIYNSTLTDNTADDGGGIAVYGNPWIANSILWDNSGGEVYIDDGGGLAFRYCDVEGCGGSSGWDSDYGTNKGGNIDEDPCFANMSSPAGFDKLFLTPDDGLKLDEDSICAESADGNYAPSTDILDMQRQDIESIDNTGAGEPNYADIGAYEYTTEDFPFITSFESCQGFEDGNSVGNYEGWDVNTAGTAEVNEAAFWSDGETSTPYYYVDIDSGTTLTREFSSYPDNHSFLRIGCIPRQGLYIKVMNESDIVAALHFTDGDDIEVLDDGDYGSTGVAYYQIANKCKEFLDDHDTNDPNYSYENTWIEFELRFDWPNDTYDVFWRHFDGPNGAFIKQNAEFERPYSTFTDISFETGIFGIALNRVSVSDEPNSGGTVGEDLDAWITYPEADFNDPLEGREKLRGYVWYDKLGKYEIKGCPTDLDPCEPNSWILVHRGTGAVDTNDVVGYWGTEKFYNGDYYLRMEVYNDLGQLHDKAIITRDITYNDTDHTVNAEYPIIGRYKPQTFHYEESADVTINWPGTFPFEFKRTYNHGLRRHFYPLFFGWTHNHNIAIIENTQTDWMTDATNSPVSDEKGLGVGRLWLKMPLGCRGFSGQVDESDANQVIYEPLDNEADYIIRTSTVDNNDPCLPLFDVEYTHYGTDGITMEFNDVNISPGYPLSESNEGLVAWFGYSVIDRKEDRFGNALIYQWDTDEIFVENISNNRNDAEMILEHDLYVGGAYLYDQIKLSDGIAEDKEAVDFGVTGYLTHQVRRSASGPNQPEMYYDYNSVDNEWILVLIEEPGPENCVWDQFAICLFQNEDGSIAKRVDYTNPGYHYDAMSWLTTYEYSYDNQGNLTTTESVDTGFKTNWAGQHSPIPEICRTTRTERGSDGAVYKRTYDTNETDSNAFDYNSIFQTKSIYYFNGYVGGGGFIDQELFYEDPCFPLKPTAIYEYFDDDGDGDYDSSSRKTTMTYDSRGNLTERRVWVDSQNYTCTQYEYHPVYNFRTCQRSWQGLSASGSKVEKLWVYGDANGTADPCGDYLIEEKSLLDDMSTADPCDDVWATTSYTYHPNGLVKTKTDPVDGITYFEYDANGFLSKQWDGATLDESNKPVGDPQKRFFYDIFGRLQLEADTHGLVKMYIHDNAGNVIETREYFDPNAMKEATVFHPDTYDDPDSEGDDEDHLNETLYLAYDWFGKCESTQLRTGPNEVDSDSPNTRIVDSEWYKQVQQTYEEIEDDEHSEFGEQCAFLEKGIQRDGKPTLETKWASHNEFDPCTCVYTAQDVYFYDGMDRVAHKYSKYEFDSDPELWLTGRHEQFEYYGTGKKKSHKVNTVCYDPGVPGFVAGPVEKFTLYYYDMLDRLTTQIEDPCGACRITDFGYDAAGNRIYVIDPNANVIFTDYDNAGRKVKLYFAEPAVYDGEDIDIDSTKDNATVKKEISYYNNNKVKSVISYDYDGTTQLAKSEFEYDSRGRIEKVTQKTAADSNAVTTYDYNDVGPTRADTSIRYA